MSNCVFCERIAKKDCRVEDYYTVSFEPLNPVTPGHRLFVPKEHVVNAAEEPGLTGKVFATASEWGFLNNEPFNLITSVGTEATQTVFHLHVHYVPRRGDDGLSLPWTEK